MDGDGTVTNFSSASAIDSSIQPTAPTPSSFLISSFQIPAGGISEDRLTFQNSNGQSFTVLADAQVIEIGLNPYNLVASYAAMTRSVLEAGDHIFLYDTTSISDQNGQVNLILFHRGLSEKYGVVLEYQEQVGTGESALPALVRLKDADGNVRSFAFPLVAEGENGLNMAGIDLTDSTSLSANQLIQYSMNSSAELSWVTKGAVADPLFYGSCTLLDSGILRTDLQGTLPISVIPVVLVLEDQRLHLANLSEIEKGVTLNYGMTAFITIGNAVQAMLIDADAVQSMPGSDCTIAPGCPDVYHPAVEPEALPDVYQQVQDLEALQTASPSAVVIASATYAGLDWPSGTGLIQMGVYYVTEDVSVYEAYTDGWGQVDYSPIGLFDLQPGMTIIHYNTSYMNTPEAPRNAFDLIIVTP